MKEETQENSNILKQLQVIKTLEVGPVHMEKKRLLTPYKIVQNGKTESAELMYVYEEPVFEPDDPRSLDLANMIVVQLALNYGLFCNEIIFHGAYDNYDQQFIKDMAANTAREIYVKKFLEPNPFLVGSVSRMPLVKQKNYLQAELVFETGSGASSQAKKPNVHWNSDTSKYAVLSSGGKDSLLSFGLLKELGMETHPVFVNESGRHWFTALNGYRYFSGKYPETTRVWTNCDRVFSWVLRQLPFIRRDFTEVRSDEYPVRLWTVAVFLFGALPLLRKRNIGRLVIGDEYDTTDRQSFKGITHYNGLFDQSRYFDNALTRYFYRKKWDISQFSILRPLSEMLIEKILVERYPDLQKNQMSCHATHSVGDRINPCGKCEKCRRIVGMLLAIGADPGNCGYTKKQIQECLETLAAKGVHQELEGAQHLTVLLREKGLLPGSQTDTVTVKHPEIMKLRFDQERSPFETFPTVLRYPLFSRYMEHADGAVRKMGRLWVDIDPLDSSILQPPYQFEKPANQSTDRNVGRPLEHGPGAKYLYGELTWIQARDRLKKVDVALLPVGSIEQHGPHLPLDTDTYDADMLAKLVARACSQPKPLVLPVIPYGVSYHHDDFTGTLSISPDTLSKLVYEIGMNAARNGITKLVIINGHGGNGPALHFAAQLINRDGHIFTCVDTGETSDTDIDAFIETPNDVHAGETETSSAMFMRPELVRFQHAKKFVPEFSSRFLNFSSKRGVGWYTRTAKISPSGVMGDPTKATREKGKKIWDLMIKRLVEFIEDLKNMSLDEIYQKKY